MTELEEKIAECAMREVERPTLGTAQQYLEVHEIVRENGRPKIARIDTADPELAVVYFPVKNEKFFYALTVSCSPDIQCWGMYSEPYTSVYLSVLCNVEDQQELLRCTNLHPTRITHPTREKQTPAGVERQQLSILHFEADTEPDAVEDKLEKMLNYLEQDSDGVRVLTEKYSACVVIFMEFQNEYHIGGATLNATTIKRLSALGLWIDFDLCVNGNSLNDTLA